MRENTSKKPRRSRNEKSEQKSSSSAKPKRKMNDKNDIEASASYQDSTGRLRSSSRSQSHGTNSSPSRSGRSTRASSANGRSPSRKKSRCSRSEDQSSSHDQSEDLIQATPDIVRPRFENGKIIDSYCWVCHKLATEHNCQVCSRVYHLNCLKKLKLGDHIDCECKIKNVGDRSSDISWHPVDLKKLLTSVAKEAVKEDKKNPSKRNQEEEVSRLSIYFDRWPILPVNDSLCKLVDVFYLVDRINTAPPFCSTGEFFMEVKWIYHNCYIVYGPDSDITHAAHTLEKNFKRELMDLEACRECYFNRHPESSLRGNLFTNVCRNPHKIVWAKLRGSPYWPAKCLKIDKTHAEVWFFGTHDKAKVMLNQVLNISRKSPNKFISQQKYREALAELEMYIANYRAKFGDFEYPEVATPINDAQSKTSRGKTKKGRQRTKSSKATSGDESADENESLPNASEKEKESLPKASEKKNEPLSKATEKENGSLSKASEDEDIIEGTPQKCKESVMIKGIRQKSKGLISENRKKPEFNLSVLHEGEDAVVESKAQLRQTFRNLSDKLADISDGKERVNSGSEDSFSEPNLVCHMTFTADEENCPNENMTVESVETVSEPQVAISQLEKNSDTSSVPLKGLFEINSNITKNLDHSHTNSNSSSRLPTNTSTTSPCVISATHSTYMDHMSVPNNSASENSTSTIPIFPINDAKRKCSMSAVDATNKRKLLTDMADQLLETADNDDEDDEITIIEETCKTKPLRESFLKNEINAKAMNELMLSCRPSMKTHLQRLVNTVVENYLSLYLDFHRHPLEKNDFKTFITVYQKLVKKIERLKLENELLKNDVTKLQEKVKTSNDIEAQKKSLEIQNFKSQKEIEVLQSKVNELVVKEDLRKRLQNDIINATKRKISQHSGPQNDQMKLLEEKIVQIKKSEEQLKEENEILKNNVFELEDKIKEIMQSKDELDIVNKNMCEENNKINVECQTSSSSTATSYEVEPDSEQESADEVCPYKKHEISELSNFPRLNDPVQNSLQQSLFMDNQHKGMVVIQQNNMEPIHSSTLIETVVCESNNLTVTESTFVGQPVVPVFSSNLPSFPIVVSANPVIHPSSNSTFSTSEESIQQQVVPQCSSSSTVTKNRQLPKKSLLRNLSKSSNRKRQKK